MEEPRRPVFQWELEEVKTVEDLEPEHVPICCPVRAVADETRCDWPRVGGVN